METSLAAYRQKRTELENQVKEFEKAINIQVQPTVEQINGLLAPLALIILRSK